MFSDIRDDGRFYETSSDSDLNDESTSRPENLFLQPSSISIDFDNTCFCGPSRCVAYTSPPPHVFFYNL